MIQAIYRFTVQQSNANFKILFVFIFKDIFNITYTAHPCMRESLIDSQMFKSLIWCCRDEYYVSALGTRLYCIRSWKHYGLGVKMRKKKNMRLNYWMWQVRLLGKKKVQKGNHTFTICQLCLGADILSCCSNSSEF